MNSEPAIARYIQALDALNELASADRLLTVLLARDDVQFAFDKHGAPITNTNVFLDIVQADKSLRRHDARRTYVPNVAQWRLSRTPPKSAWWWHPPPPARVWPNRLEQVITVALLLVSVTLAVDSTSRFVRSGLDIETAVALVASSLLAVAAARLHLGSKPEEGAEALPNAVSHAANNSVGQRLPWASALRPHARIIAAAVACLIMAVFWFRGLPLLSEYYGQQGNQLYEVGDNLGALASLTRAVQLNPNNARAHYYLGALYDIQGDTQAAITEYQYAIQNDTAPPTQAPEARNNLARAYILAGKSSEAVLELEDLMRGVHDCGAVGYAVCKNLGWAWHELDNSQWATSYLQRAIKVDPSAGIPYCLLAEIDEQEGNYAQAQANWQACEDRLDRDASRHPDNLRWRLVATQHLDADYLIARGRAQIAQDKPIVAALILAEAVRRALETSDQYLAYTYLGWAQLLVAQRGDADYSIARDTLHHAVALDASGAAAYCLLAETLAADKSSGEEPLVAWQACCMRADAKLPDEHLWLGKAQMELSAAGNSCAGANTVQP